MQEFDPHVEPIEMIDREGGKTDVKVHQLVKSLGGDVLGGTIKTARVVRGADESAGMESAACEVVCGRQA